MKTKRLILTIFLCLVTLFTLSVTSGAYFNGDVNEDTVYSTEDARLALVYAAGLETPDTVQEVTSDIDHDGYITTADAVEILRLACDLCTAPEHQYTAWFVTQEATCTEDGLAYSGCYNCSEEFYKSIPATGHNAPDQTCTTSGVCTNCMQILPAKGHTLVDDVCTECGYSTAKPAITYKNKAVAFGTTTEKVKTILGAPSEILTDRASIGSVTIYVYCADYENLGIFTFANNKLTQFYSNSKNTLVSQGAKKYSLSTATYADSAYVLLADINITQYIDRHDDNSVYSYLATVGKEYTFFTMADKTANEKLVFHITNGMRALHRQEILSYCPIASRAAYKHSLDMGTREYFSHYTPEGNGPDYRLTAEGIDWYGYGENIAAGYTDAYEISDGWYNSEGHRNNLLSEQHANLGVGIAYVAGSDYKFFGTQNFYT